MISFGADLQHKHCSFCYVMVSNWCAGLLLFIVGCSLKVCPFYYKTSRGLLCLHWTIINFLVSSSGPLPFNSSCLLISLATLICLSEHIITRNKPEIELSSIEQLAICCFVLCLDALCTMYGQIAPTEISLLILLAHITLALYTRISNRKAFKKLSMDERAKLGSVDIFADPLKPFAFLGLDGLHYLAIVLAIIAQVPALNGRLLYDFIFLIRSLGTLGMILTPPYLGGFIHFMKSFGSSPVNPMNRAKSEVFNA